jgi:prepilin-type N-terminal cleavage/methylation domain-containing protein
MKKKGFTLVEVIVVLTIFGIVGLVSVTTFLTAFRMGQRTAIQNSLLDDARYIMNTIAAEIQAGTIDYEEYFNQCVIAQTCPYKEPDPDADLSEYGNNHGYYAWQFKFGGYQTAEESRTNLDGFGNMCQDQFRQEWDYPHIDEVNPLPSPDSTTCITGPLSFSDDIDMGQNPHNGDGSIVDGSEASAFCKEVYQGFTDIPGNTINTIPSNDCRNDYQEYLNTYAVNELYLINEAGDKKTILLAESINESDKVLSKVEMIKAIQAEDDIRSYPLAAFTCDQSYNCTAKSKAFEEDDSFRYDTLLAVPDRLDSYDENYDNIYDNFVPISPLRVNVKNLRFIVSPIEDPRRAFGETDPNIQMQPQVTILMELEPSSAFKFPFISDNFNLKLQSTVTAGVLKEVPIISDL